MYQTADVLTFQLPLQAYLTGHTECFTYSYDYSSFICPTGKNPINNALKGESPSKKNTWWYIHIHKQSNWILSSQVEPGGKSTTLPIGSFSISSQLNPALPPLCLLPAFKGHCLVCLYISGYATFQILKISAIQPPCKVNTRSPTNVRLRKELAQQCFPWN